MSVAMHWDHWKKPSELSAENGSVSVGGYVRNGQWLKNERDRDQDRGGRRVPRLEPLFPIGPLTPSSPCGHKKKLKRSESLLPIYNLAAFDRPGRVGKLLKYNCAKKMRMHFPPTQVFIEKSLYVLPQWFPVLFPGPNVRSLKKRHLVGDRLVEYSL